MYDNVKFTNPFFPPPPLQNVLKGHVVSTVGNSVKKTKCVTMRAQGTALQVCVACVVLALVATVNTLCMHMQRFKQYAPLINM